MDQLFSDQHARDVILLAEKARVNLILGRFRAQMNLLERERGDPPMLVYCQFDLK